MAPEAFEAGEPMLVVFAEEGGQGAVMLLRKRPAR